MAEETLDMILSDGASDHVRMAARLMEDYTFLRDTLKEDGKDTQAGRRSLVRAAFAMIEGCIFSMKAYCLEYHENVRSFFREVKSIFRPEEVVFLREEKRVEGVELRSGIPRMRQNGKVGLEEATVGLEPNMKFAFACMARLEGADNTLRLDDSIALERFRNSILIRDRLMHPKSEAALTVTDEELETVQRATAWFMDCQFNAWEAHMKAYRARYYLSPAPFANVATDVATGEGRGQTPVGAGGKNERQA